MAFQVKGLVRRIGPVGGSCVSPVQTVAAFSQHHAGRHCWPAPRPTATGKGVSRWNELGMRPKRCVELDLCVYEKLFQGVVFPIGKQLVVVVVVLTALELAASRMDEN